MHSKLERLSGYMPESLSFARNVPDTVILSILRQFVPPDNLVYRQIASV